MSRLISVVFVALLVCMMPVVAQTPGSGDLVLKPIPAVQGMGVSNATLIDRSEIRLLRVDIAPGGVRVVHTHDDVSYHLFVPISGPVRFQQSDQSMDVAPWQPVFMKGGTTHGFTNPGTSAVTVMEIFVK